MVWRDWLHIRGVTARKIRNVKIPMLISIAVLSAFLLAVYAAGEIYRRVDHSERFRDLSGTLEEKAERFEGESEGHLLCDVSLENSRGIEVKGFLKAPAGAEGRCPAFLILGGLRTGRKTLEYVRDTRGIVLLALDYPYEGKTSGLSVMEFLRSTPEIRRSVINTVPAAMTAVDYLLGRDDVDPDRVIVIGGSLGAFFVPALAAADGRIAAAVSIYGAGDIQSILSASSEMPRWAAGPAGWLGAVLLSPVEPLKYAGGISPRPFLMVSGRNDELIPERCSRLLHEAAGEPKTVRWIDAGHVTVREEEFRELVNTILIEWLTEKGLVEADRLISAKQDDLSRPFD
jgi:dienelactone hydrolase